QYGDVRNCHSACGGLTRKSIVIGHSKRRGEDTRRGIRDAYWSGDRARAGIAPRKRPGVADNVAVRIVARSAEDHRITRVDGDTRKRVSDRGGWVRIA